METTSGLNIELLREPLKSAKHIVLTGKQSKEAGIIFPGSAAEDVAISQSRLDMMRESFVHFPQQMRELRMRLHRCLDAEVRPVDAIYVAVEAALETCMMTASDSEAMTSAEVLFRATRNSAKAVKGARSAREEVTLLVRHGFRVLLGLLENAPAVFEKTFQEPPDEATLKKLIPDSIDPLMSIVSRGPGGYALYIEKILGMEGYSFIADGHSNNRFVFDAELLEIRMLDDRPMVDMIDGVAETIIQQADGRTPDYHGCLAGVVEMPPLEDRVHEGRKTSTVFKAMTHLTSSLLHEYWVPQLLKKT